VKPLSYWDHAANGLRVVLRIAGFGWALLLLVVFATRIAFPLELEWMEGGLLHQAIRFQHGAAMYGPPSVDFVPFLYPPLYSIVLATIGSIFGVNLVVGRAISIASSIAIGAALVRAVGREGKPRAHQAVAIGLFASGYVFGWRWLDLARPDALCMALTAWALVLLRDAWGDHRKAVAAGVLLALAFWTKQTAAGFILASGIGILLVAPRQWWSYVATVAILDGGGVLALNAATDGWLWHYIYELHQSHAFNEVRFTHKTWGMLVHAAPFAITAGIVGLLDFAKPWLRKARRLDPTAKDRRRQHLRTHRGSFYWGLMLLAAMMMSALGYSTQWAEPNAFIPMIVFGALFVGVVLPTDRYVLEILGGSFALAQMIFALLVEPRYQPLQDRGISAWRESYAWQRSSRSIPSAKLWERAEAVRQELTTADGPVFALSRPYWSILAGGTGHVSSMGLNDISPAPRRELQAALGRTLDEGHYAQIWLEGDPPPWMAPHLTGYQVARRLHGRARARPLTGYMSEAGMTTPYTSDQLLLVPIAERHPPAHSHVVADFEDGTLQGFSVQGSAFGRHPVPGAGGRTPPLGPYGGEYLLSSAAETGLRGRGIAESPSLGLPRDGALELLVGTSIVRTGLRIAIVDRETARTLELSVPAGRFTLHPLHWDIPADWAGHTVRLIVEDTSPDAAIFLDDVWWVPLRSEFPTNR